MDQARSCLTPPELMKAYLFLRTASTAVTNMTTIVKSTESCILYASLNGYYGYHCELAESLEKEKADVERWKERLLEAQTGFVDWYTRLAMEKPLPPEILQMIKCFLFDP